LNGNYIDFEQTQALQMSTERKCPIHNETLIVGDKRRLPSFKKFLQIPFKEFLTSNCPNINVFDTCLKITSDNEKEIIVTTKKSGKKSLSQTLKPIKHNKLVYYCVSCRSEADSWIGIHKEKLEAEREQKIQCEHCKKHFQAHNIEQHKLTHQKRKKKTRKKKKARNKIKTKNNSTPPTKKDTGIDYTTGKFRKGIILISKRGKILKYGQWPCSNCSKTCNTVTRYRETNSGVVHLCSPCKSRIRKESFKLKRPDALDHADTGGGFEINKRKH